MVQLAALYWLATAGGGMQAHRQAHQLGCLSCKPACMQRSGGTLHAVLVQAGAQTAAGSTCRDASV
jgi:hypothetical protein